MIQNYDNSQDETKNLAKCTHLEKFIFIQQWLTQNMWCIGATICIFYNKLWNISFKNPFIWKNEKLKKKIHNPFTK
jgi:predicted phosphoadenosine phosphosulfate sulfurtransferase